MPALPTADPHTANTPRPAVPNGHAPDADGAAPDAAVPGAVAAPLPPVAGPNSRFVAQPTVIVGAGGIGHRIVLALKAALIEIHGRVPAGIRLLVFDIDDEHLAMPAGGQMVRLEPDSERFCLGPIPVARIRRNLDNLPTIAERLPCLRDLPPIATARAAKAMRPSARSPSSGSSRTFGPSCSAPSGPRPGATPTATPPWPSTPAAA